MSRVAIAAMRERLTQVRQALDYASLSKSEFYHLIQSTPLLDARAALDSAMDALVRERNWLEGELRRLTQEDAALVAQAERERQTGRVRILYGAGDGRPRTEQQLAPKGWTLVEGDR